MDFHAFDISLFILPKFHFFLPLLCSYSSSSPSFSVESAQVSLGQTLFSLLFLLSKISVHTSVTMLRKLCHEKWQIFNQWVA